MEIVKLIAYIILTLNFLYRLGAAIYILVKYEDHKETIDNLGFRKRSYYLGIIENLLFLGATNLLYWL